MVMQISGAVGIGAKNSPADVTTVQQLLNAVPSGLGGPTQPIAVDGQMGPQTGGAISRFQTKNFRWADGRVDPNGQTLGKLNDYADALADPMVPTNKLFSPSGDPVQIDGSTVATGPCGDTYGSIVACTGSTVINCRMHSGAAYAGCQMQKPAMIWTLKSSTCMVRVMPSGRTVFLGPSMMYFLGAAGPVPLSSVQYYKNTPPAAPSAPPAPYYQAGNGAGVSPGYFNQ